MVRLPEPQHVIEHVTAEGNSLINVMYLKKELERCIFFRVVGNANPRPQLLEVSGGKGGHYTCTSKLFWWLKR